MAASYWHHPSWNHLSALSGFLSYSVCTYHHHSTPSAHNPEVQVWRCLHQMYTFNMVCIFILLCCHHWHCFLPLSQASTSELYGKVQEIPQRETTPFYPRSPYGKSFSSVWTLLVSLMVHQLVFQLATDPGAGCGICRSLVISDVYVSSLDFGDASPSGWPLAFLSQLSVDLRDNRGHKFVQ